MDEENYRSMICDVCGTESQDYRQTFISFRPERSIDICKECIDKKYEMRS